MIKSFYLLSLLAVNSIYYCEGASEAQQFKLFKTGDEVNSVVIKSLDGKWCISTASTDGRVKAVPCDSTSPDQKLVLQPVDGSSGGTTTNTTDTETVMKQSDPLYQYCSAQKHLPTNETVANVKSWNWNSLWGRDSDGIANVWARQFTGHYSDKDRILLSMGSDLEPQTTDQLSRFKDVLSTNCVPVINCNAGNSVQLNEPSYSSNDATLMLSAPVEDGSVRESLTKQLVFCLVKHVSDNQTFPFQPQAPEDPYSYCLAQNFHEDMKLWRNDSSIVTKYSIGYVGKNYQVSQTVSGKALQVWSKPEIDSALFTKILRQECIPHINCNSGLNALPLTDAYIGKGIGTSKETVDRATLNINTTDTILAEQLQFQLAYCLEKRMTGAEFPFFARQDDSPAAGLVLPAVDVLAAV